MCILKKKKAKWTYVREYYENTFLGEKYLSFRYIFRFNNTKAQRRIGNQWENLLPVEKEILVRHIEYDKDGDWKLK